MPLEEDARGARRSCAALAGAWITEGFDSADLNDAKALLEELA